MSREIFCVILFLFSYLVFSSLRHYTLVSCIYGLFMIRFDENQQPADKVHCELRRAPSFSGPLMLPNRASANSLSTPIKPSGGDKIYLICNECISLVSLLCKWWLFYNLPKLREGEPLAKKCRTIHICLINLFSFNRIPRWGQVKNKYGTNKGAVLSYIRKCRSCHGTFTSLWYSVFIELLNLT